FSDLDAARPLAIDVENRSDVADEVRHRTRLTAGAEVRRHHRGIDDVVRLQRAIGFLSLAVAGERPDDFTIPEILWDSNAEDELVASRHEVRRLTLIWAAGFNSIRGADRNVDPLVPVSVEVSENQVVRAVRILFPTFIDGRDVQTGCGLLRGSFRTD